MAPHSSTLAWKIPWMRSLVGCKSMGSRRGGQDWATPLSLFAFMHWGRKWQATPVFLPGESQGQGSLVGCRLWGRTESDTTEATQQQQQQVGHNFSSKEQASFNLKAAVMICSDFGAQTNKSLSLFPLFPHLFVMK